MGKRKTPIESDVPSAKRQSADTTSTGKQSQRRYPTEEEIFQGTESFVRRTTDGTFNSAQYYKMITWNVNGLRSLLNGQHANDFQSILQTESPDILCLQETKLQWEDVIGAGRQDPCLLSMYDVFDSCSTTTKGYAGTRTYIRKGLCRGVCYDLDHANIKFHTPIPTTVEEEKSLPHTSEGRLIAVLLEHNTVVVNTYVPNAGMKLERLQYRVKEWDPAVEKFLQKLHLAGHSVLWTGDLNVAEKDYDRYFAGSYAQMQKVPGFTPEERDSFRGMLTRLRMTDVFRELYPNAAHVYSFWSQRMRARAKNAGWRLDYFVVSHNVLKRIVESFMMSHVQGSDHCPCVLWIKKT